MQFSGISVHIGHVTFTSEQEPICNFNMVNIVKLWADSDSMHCHLDRSGVIYHWLDHHFTINKSLQYLVL